VKQSLSCAPLGVAVSLPMAGWSGMLLEIEILEADFHGK
jgi:hypothetical protein